MEEQENDDDDDDEGLLLNSERKLFLCSLHELVHQIISALYSGFVALEMRCFHP